MRIHFTNEQIDFKRNTIQVVKEQIESEIHQMNEDIFPKKSIEKMATLGLMGIPIPVEHGGLGKDYVSYILAIHELSKVSATVGVILSVHTSVGTTPILTFGTEDQQMKYLPKLAKGEYLGAFALTEPSAGSDAAQLKLKAVKKGDHYLLNGSKVFITNGREADTFITFARTSDIPGPKGISAFIVEKNTPGLSIGKTENKMGLHGSSTVTLNFDQCKVASTQLLGEEGQGFTIAMSNLNVGRIGIAAQALGIAEAAYEYTRDFVMGLPHVTQSILFSLADMATKVEATKLLVYRAASQIEQDKNCIKEVSAAKLFATKTAREVTITAIDIVGYQATVAPSPLERYFRDAKVTEIYEGTSEIQRIVIAKQLLTT